jgi:hypothetical protein
MAAAFFLWKGEEYLEGNLLKHRRASDVSVVAYCSSA